MTFLDKIRKEKLQAIQRQKQACSEQVLREKIEAAPAPRSLSQALYREPHEELRLIAEVKPCSPGAEAVTLPSLPQLISEYADGGAKAVSVLTESQYFGGSLSTLSEVRKCTKLPLLHKEFIVDPYQLLEGRSNGADAALILAYYFNDNELSEIIQQTERLKMEAVVECSLFEEVPRVMAQNPSIILLNNRPIAAIPEDPGKTYTHGSVERGLQFLEKHPSLVEWKKQQGRVLISASCISKREHVEQIQVYPYDAILVGNAAYRANDRARFLKQLSGV